MGGQGFAWARVDPRGPAWARVGPRGLAWARVGSRGHAGPRGVGLPLSIACPGQRLYGVAAICQNMHSTACAFEFERINCDGD